MSGKKRTKNNNNEEKPWEGVPDVKLEWIHHWAPTTAMDCKNWPLKDVVQAKVDISFDLPYVVSTTNELLYNGKIPTNNPPINLNQKSNKKHKSKKKRKSKKKHKSNKKVIIVTLVDSPDPSDASDEDEATPTPPPLVKYAGPTTKNDEMIAIFQEAFGGATVLLTQAFEICLMIAAGLVMPEPSPNNIKANVRLANNLFALVAYDFAKGAIDYEDLPPKSETLGQWKKSATSLEVDRFDRFVNLLEKYFGPETKKGKAGIDVLATDTDFALSIYRCHPRPSSTRKGIEDINLVNFRDHNKQSFKSSGMLSPKYCYHITRGLLAQTLLQGHLLPSWQNLFQVDAQRWSQRHQRVSLCLTENQRNAFKANKKWYKTVSSGRMDCNKDAKDDDKNFVAKMAGKEIIEIDSDSTEDEVDVTTVWFLFLCGFDN